MDFGENLGLTKRVDNRDVGATGMWYLHGTAVWTLRCGTRVYARYRGRRVKSMHIKPNFPLNFNLNENTGAFPIYCLMMDGCDTFLQQTITLP